MNNSPLPSDLCERNPELQEYGFYRKLNDGKLEFKKFCDKDASDWFAIHKKDFEEILDSTIPSQKAKIMSKFSIQQKAIEAFSGSDSE